MFERAAEEQPARIVLQNSPQPFVYELVKAWAPAGLEDFAGGYFSTELDTRYDISLRDGALLLRAGTMTLAMQPRAEGEFVGEGLLGEGEPFTVSFDKPAAPEGFLLYVSGAQGIRFTRSR